MASHYDQNFESSAQMDDSEYPVSTEDLDGGGGGALSSSWDITPGTAGITDHNFTGYTDSSFYRSHGDFLDSNRREVTVCSSGSGVSTEDLDGGGGGVSSSWDITPGPAGITDHNFTGYSDPSFYRSHGDFLDSNRREVTVCSSGSGVSTEDLDGGGGGVSSSWDITPGPAGITDHNFTGYSDPSFYRSHGDFLDSNRREANN